MTARTLAVVALAAAFEASCIFLVDQSPSGDQFTQACGLASATTTCGACMTQSCAAELTACCTDTTCRDVLAQVDQCAEAGACVFDMSSAAAAALGKCIDAKCTACSAEPANAFDGGQVYCGFGSSTTSCQCSSGEGFTNATRCDVTSMPNAICCADTIWPNAGSSCTCSSVTCTSYGDSCTCGPNEPGNASCNTNVGICCANQGFCSCDSAATQCSSGTTSVSDCSLPDVVGCGTSQVRVNNCSATAN